MADLMTEAEQIELLKKLWKEYGVPAIIGVAIAMVIIFGWRYYKQYKVEQADTASLVFAHLMIDELNNNPTDALKQATILRQQFSSTPYATLSALYAAKYQVSKKDYVKAQSELKWAMDNGANSSFRQIARIRSARILIEQQQPQAALTLLSKVTDDAFGAAINVVRGDAYQQLKEFKQARLAYQESLKVLPDDASLKPLVEMKLHSVPETK